MTVDPRHPGPRLFRLRRRELRRRAVGRSLGRGIALGLLAVMLTVGVGCDAMIKSAMLDAPNRGQSFDGEANVLEPGPAIWNIDHQLYVPVGPPDATLRLWINHPTLADADIETDADAEVDAEAEQGGGLPPARGTVLVLHGWRAEAFWMRHVADSFAEAGYRAVMVDLRGHGGSTGDAITFGALESRDLVQVIDALADHDLLTGPVGVWGASMGAATAIQLAARDERVDAVVAVAPYTSMREITPLVTRRLLPVMHLASDEDLDRLVQEAAEENDFDPDEADTLAAMRKVRAPVLIVHGIDDLVVPVSHGRKLHEAAAGPAELVELDWTGHFSAHFSHRVTRHSVDFFNRTFTESAASDDEAAEEP